MVLPTVSCHVEEVSGEAVLGALSGGGLVLLRDNFCLADGSYQPDGAYTDRFDHGHQEVTEHFLPPIILTCNSNSSKLGDHL